MKNIAPPINRISIPLLVLMLMASLLVVASAPGQEPPAQQDLTVMSWNLEWFFDDQDSDTYSKLAKEKVAPSRSDWDWRRDAVAAAIAKANPTVVALQEIENRRVLWYLTRALDRNHSATFEELFIEGHDHFTEQDVGMLFRSPADALLVTQMRRTSKQRGGTDYFDVSKHLLAVFDFPAGDSVERVTVMNVHLRSRLEGLPMRLRQARLVHQWIGEAVSRGENVIVLGDMNSEESGNETTAESDLGILSGMETPQTNDDLVDLHHRIPDQERQTHLLPGRQFDRVLVSRSLIDDDPNRPDLVFKSIKVDRDLAIQGEPDQPEAHWERYWKLPADERDLSDHYPVIATFGIQ